MNGYSLERYFKVNSNRITRFNCNILRKLLRHVIRAKDNQRDRSPMGKLDN